MAYKIVMPQLGLTMEEGSVTSWLKKPGDFVEKGEALFTVETGVKVPVGTLLAMLNDEPETDA